MVLTSSGKLLRGFRYPRPEACLWKADREAQCDRGRASGSYHRDSEHWHSLAAHYLPPKSRYRAISRHD